ncbi:MAG: hypothetical protein JNL58_30575 [Planctomyces sp.]|nr:hypothetical protein [Planctomyces sp.]
MSQDSDDAAKEGHDEMYLREFHASLQPFDRQLHNGHINFVQYTESVLSLRERFLCLVSTHWVRQFIKRSAAKRLLGEACSNAEEVSICINYYKQLRSIEYECFSSIGYVNLESDSESTCVSILLDYILESSDCRSLKAQWSSIEELLNMVDDENRSHFGPLLRRKVLLDT